MERSKVFVSWSGERSRLVAKSLGDWLEDVLQGVRTFMSDTNIAAGDLWFERIADNIADSVFAVICVTPENLTSEWLHFEAGAIGMSRERGTARPAVAPFLVGLGKTDLAPPLSLYQAVTADRDGAAGLVRSINNRLPTPVEATRLQRTFEAWWPSLEAELAKVPDSVGSVPESEISHRPDRAILNEILSLLRDQAHLRTHDDPISGLDVARASDRARIANRGHAGSANSRRIALARNKLAVALQHALSADSPVNVDWDKGIVTLVYQGGLDPENPQARQRVERVLAEEGLGFNDIEMVWDPF